MKCSQPNNLLLNILTSLSFTKHKIGIRLSNTFFKIWLKEATDVSLVFVIERLGKCTGENHSIAESNEIVVDNFSGLGYKTMADYVCSSLPAIVLREEKLQHKSLCGIILSEIYFLEE